MRLILVIIGIVLSPLIAFILYGAGLWILGYQINVSPEAFAQQLAAEGRSGKDCLLIRKFDIIPSSPNTDRQGRCAEEYARLTGDISVCKFLGRNSHTLQCLFEIEENLFPSSHCSKSAVRNEFYCSDYSQWGELRITNPQIENCSKYEREDVRDLCYKTRTQEIPNIHECSFIKNEAEKDLCESDYAFKEMNSSLCNAIVDNDRNEYCKVWIDTWIKYPQLHNADEFFRNYVSH